MTPRRFIGVVIIMVLMIGIAIMGNLRPNFGADAPSRPSTLLTECGVPDYVVYGLLFKKVAFLSKKTRDLWTHGRIRSEEYFPLRREASLTDEQSKTLESISASLEIALADQDEKARKIIEDFRSKFPPGKLPKDTRLPPPPPELVTMTNERNNIILKARDRVRLAFGEASFASFDQYAKQRYQTGNHQGPHKSSQVESR